MSGQRETKDPPRHHPPRHHPLWQIILVLGSLGAASSFVLMAFGLIPTFKDWFDRAGAVELSGSYEGEIWKTANEDDFGWLARDSWCYPTLRGFKSEYRVAGGVLEQRNSSPAPDAFITEWVPLDVYISNLGVLRMHDTRKKWDVMFVDFEPGDPTEYRENNRFVRDDGSVDSGDKRLALSCTRCSLTQDGFTYDCGK
jgi:hypothetical protein